MWRIKYSLFVLWLILSDLAGRVWFGEEEHYKRIMAQAEPIDEEWWQELCDLADELEREQ